MSAQISYSPPDSVSIFDPVELGALSLRNRIVMPPMTRHRGNTEGVVPESTALYYAQRSSAGLIVSEGLCISPNARGDYRHPGIWNSAQIDGWKRVTQAVHDSGGVIIAQIWHTGRASHSLVHEGKPAVAPSAVRISGTRPLGDEMVENEVPRALQAGEIADIVSDYAAAAANAMQAGFDGVELHGANGYLVDQFLQNASNRRVDGYGGSVQNRARFLDETVQAISDEIGAERVAVRISPASTFQDMGDSDPEVLWEAVTSVLSRFDLAFVHCVERGMSGFTPVRYVANSIDSAWIRVHYSGNVVATGQYDLARAESAIRHGVLDAVGFGRPYISNPDLVERFRRGATLVEADRHSYYDGEDVGYIDWPKLDGRRLEYADRVSHDHGAERE